MSMKRKDLFSVLSSVIARYEILCPNVIPKEFMDGKIVAQKMVACLKSA